MNKMSLTGRFPALAAALVFAGLPASGRAAEPSAVLGELARQMAEARADPAKARSARCPSNAGVLAGVPLGQVLIELGQPNVSGQDNSLTYSYGRSNAGERGGGFPELTFRFNGQGVVSGVECHVAK
jgi:hypothetical protein